MLTKFFEYFAFVLGIICIVCILRTPQYQDDMVALLVGHRTCDSSVAGESCCCANYTCVPLSLSSITWYWSKDTDSLRLGRLL